jgi:3-hydroxyacyl-CoA dehydrogenase/enoyl-CoA hydratase/3-hydroxybutyryl-CoA epimerase
LIDTTGLPMPKNAPPSGTCVKVERPEPGLVQIVLDPPHRAMPVLDMPLLRDLEIALEQVERDPSVRGLVITGRDARTFAAGADIDAIAALTSTALVERVVEIGQKLFERIAALSVLRDGFVSVAAVGGAAPGGAYELSLACSFIVACDVKETRIGLPETQLGILPGWGGSTRLPRRIGVPKALEAILTGRLYTAREAKRMGLVDRTAAPEDLRAVAASIAMGREKLERRSRGLAGIFVDKNPIATALIASKAREQVLARTRGHYPAPLAAIDIVSHAPRRSIEASLRAEREAIPRLAVGPVCKNLIRIFGLSESAKKQKQLPDGTNAKSPTRVGVLGAGVMGRDIASLSAERGAWTRLYDIAPAALDVALIQHRSGIEERKKRRKLERNEADAAIDKLDVTRELAGFAHCELVVEAVAERLDVKRQVFGALAKQMSGDAILATNTSSLSVDAIAEGLPHPERVVGLHFFNPVKRMPLVEIVRGTHTDARTIAACAAFALTLGKTPVVVADQAGFVVNRLLGPYLDEALRLFAGGVDPAKIDHALREFGMPMGPLELLDEVGFDIAQHAAKSLHAAYGERMTPSTVLDGMVAQKRLGKKTGQGFYVHAGGKKSKPRLSDDLARFVPADAPRIAASSQAHMTETAIAERLVLAMVAEAARALDDKAVASARELDLATVFGMGFPPFRGGLLAFADTLGAASVAAKLDAIAREPDVAARTGGRARFEPPPSLRDMARDSRTFHAAAAASAG